MWAASAAAGVGASVVLAVHYGRAWAEGTCTPSGDCPGVNASLTRYLLLVLGVALGALVALIGARVPRAWLVAPVAFALQGSAMFVVEHADGFWLPLWLDVIVGAATWSATVLLVST